MTYPINEILTVLEEKYPASLAMSFDNPGLQVGRRTGQAGKAAVALDVTEEVIDRCIREDIPLLVTHHPLMLDGIRQVTDASLAGRRALRMAEHRIAHFSIHTNYDVVDMGRLAADRLGLEDREILELTCTTDTGSYGIGVSGLLPAPLTLGDCCHLVCRAFDLDGVRLFGKPEQPVRKMAVSPGSGKSMIASALEKGAEVLVTGDIGHHDGLDAREQGLAVIDAGHYGVEQIFIGHLSQVLRERFPGLELVEIRGLQPFMNV